MTYPSILIYGAGGVGGTLAAKLAAGGMVPTLVARAAHGAALAADGLVFSDQNGETRFDVPVVTDVAGLGVFDVIVVATKAYSHREILPTLLPLMHDETMVLFACNGLPWWLLQQAGLEGFGAAEFGVPLKHVVGCVCYNAASVVEAGHVRNIGHPRLLIGEIDGGMSARIERLAAVFEAVGFRDVARQDIRVDMLDKLCWNVSFNPLSVIFGLDSGQLVLNVPTGATIAAMIGEMQGLADALGIPLRVDAGKHLALGEKAGSHKPSMLQDFEAGKALEVDALIGDVCKLADALGVDMPVVARVLEELLAKQ